MNVYRSFIHDKQKPETAQMPFKWQMIKQRVVRPWLLVSTKKGHFFFSNWRIIALQCCVAFYHIRMWISHKNTCAPSLVSLPGPSHRIPTLWVITEHELELLVSCSSFPLAVCFVQGRVCASMLLSQSVPLSFLCCVHKYVLYVCVSPAALQIDSSVPFF